LLAFTVSAQFLGMHIDAVGAAVDLGCPQLHQLKELVIKATFAHKGMQLAYCLVALRRVLPEIQSSFHGIFL
jgi:hypothetical protein